MEAIKKRDGVIFKGETRGCCVQIWLQGNKEGLCPNIISANAKMAQDVTTNLYFKLLHMREETGSVTTQVKSKTPQTTRHAILTALHLILSDLLRIMSHGDLYPHFLLLILCEYTCS